MKMKILLLLIFFLLLIMFTYKQLEKDEINYTILGDKGVFSNNIISKNFSELIYDNLQEEKDFGFYSKEFIYDNARIIDIINDINDNKKVDNISIQNILDRTNLMILSIGSNEVNYKLSKLTTEENNDIYVYKYLDEVLNDLKVLVDSIRQYNKGNIIFLGFFNDTSNTKNNKYYKYLNKNALNIMKDNNIEFIDLYNILNKNNDFLTKTNPIYITNDGNIAIFNRIYSKIDELYLHKIS